MRAKEDLTDNDRTAILQQLLARVQTSPSPLVLNEARFAESGTELQSTCPTSFARASLSAEGKKFVLAGTSSRNLKLDSVAAHLKLVPKARRTTFRSIATAMSKPQSALHDYYRRGIFVKYSSTIKPALTDSNKAVQLNMMDCVHVDEKWFFATRVHKSYYLAPDEAPPHRTVKSKTFITKVMFLSAVA
ncbi:hypothetical protein H257_14323 [Aphanomyces astaci]|uniref:Uncharacterized protein n=1 Tax=Aphanomyces astaci TaxID=112090 RepID=W4FU33_APHAT|nr:hypothetical protein H257_14323 [Aphanomyces astaci]ETV70158.1 hypothetical protein H257_14323 [Aphanomyces astaci]|eukprot:XP_009840389.1 hypothetical protein H257_14323 [Aphanomyces astaci]